MPSRVVKLRAEKDGADRRFLDAQIDDDGALVISGHDLGPGAGVVSPDNEYEWARIFDRDVVPALLQALGGEPGINVLDLLEREFTGSRSCELERILRDTEDTISRRFWSWP